MNQDEDNKRTVPDPSEPEWKARIESLLAVALQDNVSAAEAIKKVDQVLSTHREIALRSSQDRSETLNSLMNIGESYRTLSCYEQALSVNEEALLLAKQLNDRSAEATLLRKIATILIKHSRWEEAKAHLRRSAEIFSSLNDNEGYTRCKVLQANVKLKCGDHAAAELTYLQALETAEQFNLTSIIADVTMNLGILGTIRGDFDEAKGYLRNALALHEQMRNVRGVAQIYHNLGMCYRQENRWNDALEAFERALEINLERGDMHPVALNYENKGAVYIEMGEYTMGAALCARALDIFRETNYSLGIAEVYKFLGRLLTHKGDWSTARGLLEQSLRLYQQFKDPLGEAEAQRELGVFYAEQKEIEAASSLLETARKGFQRLGAHYDALVTQKILDEKTERTKLQMIQRN